MPTALPASHARAGAGLPPTSILGALVLLRSALALTFQLLAVLAFLAAGSPTPWRSAADYWLATFALAEVLNLALLPGFRTDRHGTT